MFSIKEVTDYYDQTQPHYERWWNLSDGLSLHYGIWKKETSHFLEALENTNTIMATAAKINAGDHVLDAGCGVGGAAFYLARKKKAIVKGISLSQKQLDLANNKRNEFHLEAFIDFSNQDYTKTNFRECSFDVVWACESMNHAADRKLFLKEVYRVLKPGGRLVLADFFLADESAGNNDPDIKNWRDSWAMAKLPSAYGFEQQVKESGLGDINIQDYTEQIMPTSRRMYWAYWLGAIPSKAYNFMFNASRFSREHYKSGYYQYKSLRKGLWSYLIISAVKR